jgi:enoyl-CoA hydratase/carnithine racemase
MSAVELDLADGVAVVRLNRPDRLNAFTRGMGVQLGHAYARCDEDDEVRVVVLTGAGRAFCAGADLAGGDGTFAAPDAATFTAAPVDPPAYRLRKPVIAAVNGAAVGIGLTLALHADIRVMARDAVYSVPQVRYGVVPDEAAHALLPRLVGASVAAEILLTGRRFDGVQAAAWGLASRAVDAARVLPEAMEMAADIVQHVAPLSAAYSKRLLWDAVDRGTDLNAAAAAETRVHLRLMGHPDTREAFARARGGTSGDWHGRVSRDWLDPHTDG